MPNTIALRKTYTELLDEVYKLESLTAVLDGPNELVRAGANAHEILIPKMSTDGLADYSRNSGYVAGSVTFAYETKTIAYDRGRMFQVDALDVSEAFKEFGLVGSTFMRTAVIPELDCYRFAQYAAKAGTKANGALTTGANAIAAISAAKTAIKDAEGDVSTCILYIKPAIYDLIADMDTTKSRAALEGWKQIIQVPSARFFAACTLTAAGGFTGSNALNFLVVDTKSVIQFQKHEVSKTITPEQNQNADAWKFGFRTAGIAEAYDNKVNGIYAHSASAQG